MIFRKCVHVAALPAFAMIFLNVITNEIQLHLLEHL